MISVYLRTFATLLFGFAALSEVHAQDPLTVGSTTNLGVLPLIAKNENIFSEMGLTVEYKKFQTGKMTMDALISGDIEAGTIVDSNVAFINYSKNPVKVIASIATRLDDAIYFNKNKNISAPKDLVGKRVGFAPATTSHIFLAKFLKSNQIKWSEIKPVILQAPAMEAALKNGAVDAVSIWQPWGVNIEKISTIPIGYFSNNAELYPSRILLASTDKVIQKRPEALKKLISSLEKALKVYANKSVLTYSYLAPELGTSEADLEKVLKPFHFSVELGSSALPLVETIGQWIASSQEDFKGQAVPSYEGAFNDQLLANLSTDASKTEYSVVMCRPNNMVSALPYIADAKGYFKSRGLNIKFEKTTNAKICQDMLLANNADYMTGAEGPFTYLAASNPPIKILAMLQQNPETSIFARKDKGITKFEDLKGKRVAYLPGTVSYFFLGRVMKKFGIRRSDLQLTAMQPPTMPAALVGGSVDAFAMWEPWGAQAATQSPENIINLTDTALYQYEALLSGRNEAIAANPEVPKRILHALIEAEQFIKENNSEAFDILSKVIAFEENAFKRLWNQYKHTVRLDDKPIKLMEENFELLKEDDANFKDVPSPNFRSFVDTSFLKTIDPTRVELNE